MGAWRFQGQDLSGGVSHLDTKNRRLGIPWQKKGGIKDRISKNGLRFGRGVIGGLGVAIKFSVKSVRALIEVKYS